ncbi:MAG: competence/damage-inducible protein A [Acidimicrobiia bacterium]|jgi:nicotinamide-nucleotide amidase|nr:competence/damage-inducible protein A [Acidimicrobiia bacterium]
MRCDVVAIGTELLLGQVIDTNSAHIGERLAANGIDSLLQIKVGDNLSRMISVLGQRIEQAEAVIVCGGLGPTHDDITREAIAAVMGAKLVEDEQVAETILHMFAARGRRMPMNNLRQAQVPVGATVIPQTRGTAPGLICPVGDSVIYAVPGVPHEMREMLERAILPDLRRRAGVDSVIVSRVIRTWGDSESGLGERLAGIIDELDEPGRPTLAFLASGWEGLKIRLTTRAATSGEGLAELDVWERRIVERIGSIVFGYDDDTMESVVIEMMRRRGLTLALAESVTGGLVAARLTEVPGVSDVLRGAVVSYATDVKVGLLDVPAGPVVSEQAATAMADHVRRLLGADVGLSLTGVAGPDRQDDEPPGTLWVGLAFGDSVEAHLVRLPGDRTQMRQFSVITALDALRHRLVTRTSPVTPRAIAER